MYSVLFLSCLLFSDFDILSIQDLILQKVEYIFLDQYLECPYYLTPFSLTVFSEKEAFKLHMFSDDIRKFGLMKALNARKSEDEA